MISTRTISEFMSLTIEHVNRLFENLSTGNASAFFDNVADDGTLDSHGNTSADWCVTKAKRTF